MVVDTSAIIAILFGEPEAEVFAEAIEFDAVRLISAVSVLAAAIVVESELGDPGARELDLLLYQAGITVVPFSPDHLAAAAMPFGPWQGPACRRAQPGRLVSAMR